MIIKDLAERNNIYHTILDMIKTSQNHQQAATDILLFFEQYMENKQAEQEESGLTDPKLKSTPIFRRCD